MNEPVSSDKGRRQLEQSAQHVLDSLTTAHFAVTSGTGYDPAKYASTYSEAAQLIQRLLAELDTLEATPSSAVKARSTYEPLTEKQIDGYRTLCVADIGKLCDMAANSLLYAEEVQRLRDGPPSTAGITRAQFDAAFVTGIDRQSGTEPHTPGWKPLIDHVWEELVERGLVTPSARKDT